MPKSQERIAAIMADPTESDWLKNTLKSALSRDCLDSARDCEWLAICMNERLEEITAEYRAELDNRIDDQFKKMGI